MRKIVFLIMVVFALATVSVGQDTALLTGGYVDNGDGTIKDNTTGLMWQKGENPKTYYWGEAKDFCKELNLAGTGWRLPHVIELMSLVKKDFVPAIDSHFFPDTVADSYWSSTISTMYTNHAWLVSFSSGSVSYYFKNNYYHVRCVRGRQETIIAHKSGEDMSKRTIGQYINE